MDEIVQLYRDTCHTLVSLSTSTKLAIDEKQRDRIVWVMLENAQNLAKIAVETRERTFVLSRLGDDKTLDEITWDDMTIVDGKKR